jgi:hypothetical protein
MQDAHERPHLKEKKEIHVQTTHNSYAPQFKVTEKQVDVFLELRYIFIAQGYYVQRNRNLFLNIPGNKNGECRFSFTHLHLGT